MVVFVLWGKIEGNGHLRELQWRFVTYTRKLRLNFSYIAYIRVNLPVLNGTSAQTSRHFDQVNLKT